MTLKEADDMVDRLIEAVKDRENSLLAQRKKRDAELDKARLELITALVCGEKA